MCSGKFNTKTLHFALHSTDFGCFSFDSYNKYFFFQNTIFPDVSFTGKRYVFYVKLKLNIYM
jgi:hypothetical protein